MLVLTRKLGEEVVITTANGETIIVKLLESKRGNMRLGFTAPQSMSIVRAGTTVRGPKQSPAEATKQ